MKYDVVIIWAWAAWLYAWINLDKSTKKIILEKNAKPWIKVLLSWWERANVSNMDIEPMRDYFTQNKKFLLSVFSKYTNWDIISYFAENNVEIVEEDRSRLILKSGDSKELLKCLLQSYNDNNWELKLWDWVVDIDKLESWEYIVKTSSWKKYQTKKVIVSAWWKSFAQVWTTWDWYSWAEKLGINIITPYRTLCWMATNRELKDISGISSVVDMKLIDKSNNKEIYTELWPILFTHFGISGPIIHNLSNAIWEYLNNIWLKESDFENYIKNNLKIDIKFDLENSAKRLVKFFDLHPENLDISLDLQNWRSWKEAKATGGWVDTNELNNHMESKKHKWLYFIGEVVDVTWKTGWFNLQWAWSSSYVAAKNINW